MARNLLEAGHSLYIHNRTLSKCDALATQGATYQQLSGACAKARAPVALLRASDYSVILLRRFINAERLV